MPEHGAMTGRAQRFKVVVQGAAQAVVLAAALAGCVHQQAPDEALVAELLGAARATLAALPPERRPDERELSSRVELIASHAHERHVAAVRAGTLTQGGLLEAFHATLHRRAAGDRAEPPLLLTLLEHASAPWSIGQCLLFDALLAQYQQEAGLERPEAELQSGAR
jgi:hypothetical protein